MEDFQKCSGSALILMFFAVLVLLPVSAVPIDRRRRSDDSDPLQAVVEKQGQQLVTMQASLAALQNRLGEN